MAPNRVFSGVVKVRMGHEGGSRVRLVGAAAYRGRCDTNTAPRMADQRSGKGLSQGLFEGLFQPCLAALSPVPRGILGNRPVQCREQGFELAEFYRPFMSVAIDGALEQPKPDFLRQRGKGFCIEGLGVVAPTPCWAALERKIALGAAGEDFDRGVGPREPRGEPRERARIAAFGREHR